MLVLAIIMLLMHPLLFCIPCYFASLAILHKDYKKKTIPLLSTLISAAIQFSFGPNLPTGDEAGVQQIFLPFMINIVPSTALLQSDVILSITAIDGSATSKYHKHIIAGKCINEYLAQSKLVSGFPISFNNHIHFLLFYSTCRWL